MIGDMLACDDKSRFTLLLPSAVKVAHKTGSVTRVRTDAGLLMGKECTIALCVLTDNNDDTRWSDDNAGNRLCAEIAKATYDVLAPKVEPTKSDSTEPQSLELKLGATGEMVETLQRTLNVRMPSLQRICRWMEILDQRQRPRSKPFKSKNKSMHPEWSMQRRGARSGR